MKNEIDEVASEELKSALIPLGFAPTTYQGQEGEFLAKKLSVCDMPYLRAHNAPDFGLEDSDEVIVEILLQDEKIQMVIPSVDYCEEAVPLNSEDGLSLLKDAGVELAIEAFRTRLAPRTI